MSDGLSAKVTVTTIFDDRRDSDAAVSVGTPQNGARLGICGVVAVAAFAMLGVRLGGLALHGEAATPAAIATAAAQERTELFDRKGRPLAVNTRQVGFAIDGREVFDTDEAVSVISRILPQTDRQVLHARLGDRRYVHLENVISADQQRALRSSGLPGLRFPSSVGRAYPQKALAAHVTGYTEAGNGGRMGMEASLDGNGPAADAPEGRLRLSIDLVAQQILEEELSRALVKFDGKAAWGVLLDARNGEVRALASLPTFNLNTPGAFPADTWRNRAMSDRYELGSAFKPITMAAAFEAGLVDEEEIFDIPKTIDVGGWSISDYSQKKSRMTPSEIMQHSSNIGTVQIVQRLGEGRFTGTLGSLNLLDALPTELPERRAPAYSKAWRPAELATASYGHGISVTPLQLTAAFAAVVNGGEFRRPTFLAEGEQNAQRVFSQATSDRMRIILRRTVTDGTGRNADAEGYYVIGKTATADKPDVGGYKDDGALVSSFIGAFPGYDPAYVLLVSVDEPNGIAETHNYATAGWVAAPVFKRVVERAAPALGIMPVADDIAFDGFIGRRRPELKAAAAQAQAEDAPDALTLLLRERTR